MSQRIVGLDIGLSGIKVVRLDRKISGIDLYDSSVVKLNGAGDLSFEERVSNGIKSIISQKKLSGDITVVSLPGDLYSVRRLVIPFDDPKKIAQVLPFEIESQLPFAIEDVIVDYYTINKKAGSTEVLAAVIQKTEIEKYLRLLESSGVDPAAVTIGPFALFNYYSYFYEYFGEEKDLIAVDVNGASSIVMWIKNGKLSALRSIAIGAERFRVSNEPQGDENPNNFLLDDLVRNIRLTVRSFLPEDYRADWRFHIGGINIPGLSGRLLETPAKPISVKKARRFIPTKIDDDLHVSCGLALSQVLGDKGANLNFRTGVFSRQKEIAHRKRFIFLLVFSLTLLLGGGLADLYVRAYNMEQRADYLSQRVRDKFLKSVPEVKKIVNELQQMKVALAKFKKNKKILRNNAARVTTLLSRVSDVMPVVLDVLELNIEGSRMSILAVTGSFDDVNKIKESLEQLEDTKEVKVSDAKVSAQDKKVKFKISITLKESL